MRRALPLLLSLLLVCAQGAGLWHGIGHTAAPHPAAARAAGAAVDVAPMSVAARLSPAPAPAEPGDGRCDKCFQFAHFASGAAPELAFLPVDETTVARPFGALAALGARAAPPARSRGPPVLL